MAVIVVVPNPDTEAGPPRIAASLVSSLRAVRGQVPAAGRITVVEFADLRARLEPAAPGAAQDSSAAAASAETVPAEAAASGAVAGAAGLAAAVAAVAGASGLPGQRAVAAAGDGAAAETCAAAGEAVAAGDGAAVAADIEQRLLEGWWGAAVRIGQGRGLPGDLAAALGETPHFAHQQHPPVHLARELRRYLTDRKYRHELRDRTQACIGPETKVVVGQGIGGLIAYEALCTVSDAVAVTLVTLGPALCGPRVVFDLLDPPPRSNQGEWPASVRHWSNIVAHTDVTAQCEARLTARFGPGIDDLVIEPRAITESLTAYLLDRSTGLAVATGLSAEFR